MNYQHLILGAAALILSLMMAASTAADASLADAAARGDLGSVRQLLRDGADVNDAHGDGMTALHWAAERGDADLAGMLIYAGCNLEGGTRIGRYTPLHVASRNGNSSIVKLLLDAGADPGAATSNSGVMPIHLAAASGSTEATLALLDAGADVNATGGTWDQTPLIFAASANRTDVIRILVNAGGDLSSASRSIDTADMEEADKAAEKRLAGFLADFKAKEGGGPNWQPQPSQVQAAIEASREIQRKWPDVPDPSCDDFDVEEGDAANKCANPITYNADGEPVDGYDVGKKDDEEPRPATYGQQVGSWGGLAPLHHAVRQGHKDAVLTLLEDGADIDQPIVGDQSSPLLVAAINGQFDIAMLLLEKGADPNHRSVVGTTPLFATLERQWAPRASYSHPTEHQQQATTHLELMRALLDAGANPNVRLDERLWFTEYTFAVLGAAGVHYKGATPFWRAAHALDLDAMTLLKEHGADPGLPTVKLPPRRRRTPNPPEQQIQAGDSKKATTVASFAAAEKKEEKKEEDQSGLPPIAIGGPFIHPVHVAAGAGYGQQFAGNAHRYVPGNWLPAVRFLVEECGADVNLRDANGYSALHHAASRGDNELVQYLIDQGADVMVVSRKGQTTVDMANGPIQRLSPFPETIALLESYGAINNHNCVSC